MFPNDHHRGSFALWARNKTTIPTEIPIWKWLRLIYMSGSKLQRGQSWES